MRRAGVVVALVATLVVFTGAGAGADDVATGVGEQAWVRTGLVPTVVGEAGRVYVAADGGLEQARAFFSFSDETLEAAAATLTLAEADGPLSFGDAVLVSCPLTSPLVGSGELTADSAPSVDCDSPSPLTHADDGTWTLELADLMPAIEDGSAFGVAVVPDVADAATFHVAFDTTATLVELAPAPEPPVAAPPARPTEEPAVIEDLPSPVTAGGIDLEPAKPVADTEPSASSGPVGTVTAVGTRALGAVASPPAAVLGLVALLALAPGVRIARRRPATDTNDGRAEPRVQRLAKTTTNLTAVGLALALPATLDEASVYKVGLVLILVVGAIGLHLLVNWAGELSLAHATMIGLPAFAVAKLSADHGVSPILLLPVGIVVGAAAGALVGLPAIRARGLQVALVTLAAGVAIDRFFFTKTWFVGPAAGAAVEVPSLGPLQFATARSLYVVLVVLVAVAAGVAWVLYRSTLVRALLWVKADQSAAAAFGVPVARFRALAYAIAGAYAGFAGGLTAMWVQRLTPQAFPLERSFAYLIVVVLAGRGFLGGVVVAALAVEGGRLFLANGDALMVYAGPIGLLLTLITNREGLNGMAVRLVGALRAARLPALPASRKESTVEEKDGVRGAVRPVTLAGVIALVVGFAAIALAWYHAGNTDQVWVQNQELISGGLGGMALVVLGVGLLVYDRVSAERAVVIDRWERLIAALEARRADDTADIADIAAGAS